MKVTLNIKRFNPERDKKPYWKTYDLDMEPNERVLDALHRVRDTLEPSLAFRRSCGHGICGSDAMQINGKNRLACRELIRDHQPRITLKPLRGFRVVRDLVVDLDDFFEKYRSVAPYLLADGAPPRERLQTPEQLERFDDTSKCILCAACTTSCPINWTNRDYLGPAAIVNAHRFIFDSRDEGGRERLKRLNTREGVWRCRTVFNCTAACPRGIEVTRAIQEIKRALLYNKEVPGFSGRE